MNRRKPRGLRPDEEELWNKVRSNAVPLHPTQREVVKAAVDRTMPKISTPARSNFATAEPVKSSTAIPRTIATTKVNRGAPAVHMDYKNFGRMKKGKLSPEARIDLHGMTLQQAHPALNRFILDSHAAGKRLVLVITGKGKSSLDLGVVPERRGVLNHQVPNWLQSAALRAVVLQVSKANLKHGGSGAYYVYLRRRR